MRKPVFGVFLQIDRPARNTHGSKKSLKDSSILKYRGISKIKGTNQSAQMHRLICALALSKFSCDGSHNERVVSHEYGTFRPP